MFTPPLPPPPPAPTSHPPSYRLWLCPPVLYTCSLMDPLLFKYCKALWAASLWALLQEIPGPWQLMMGLVGTSVRHRYCPLALSSSMSKYVLLKPCSLAISLSSWMEHVFGILRRLLFSRLIFSSELLRECQIHPEGRPTTFAKETWFSAEVLLNLLRNYSAAFLFSCFLMPPFPVSISYSSLQIVVHSLLCAGPPTWERGDSGRLQPWWVANSCNEPTGLSWFFGCVEGSGIKGPGTAKQILPLAFKMFMVAFATPWFASFLLVQARSPSVTLKVEGDICTLLIGSFTSINRDVLGLPAVVV